MSPQRPAETIAAVDLGSNSFHMVVARLVDDLPMPVDRLRERVALAAGLDEKGRISKEAQQRAVECLERFGQRLRDTTPPRSAPSRRTRFAARRSRRSSSRASKPRSGTAST